MKKHKVEILEELQKKRPMLRRYQEVNEKGLSPTETFTETLKLAVEEYLLQSGYELPKSAPCEHPEKTVENFFDGHPEAAEHAEWCSLCGAHRVVSGYDNTPWTLPHSIKRMLGEP